MFEPGTCKYLIVLVLAVLCFGFIIKNQSSKSQITELVSFAENLHFSSSDDTFADHIFSNPKKTTAICLIGVPQSWTNTSKNFLKNVLLPLRADLFIITPAADDPLIEYIFPYATEIKKSYNDAQVVAEFDEKSPSWKKLLESSSKKSKKNGFNFLGGLPGNPASLKIKHAASQIVDNALCEKMISENEQRRGGFNYDWVAFGRLDLMWTEKHPDLTQNVKISNFDPQTSKLCYIPCQGNDWGGYCDHWSFCTRKAAKEVALGPFDLIERYESWTGKFSGSSNREQMVKYNLKIHDVKVERFHADFFRTCKPADIGAKGNHQCAFLPRYHMFGKSSGNQLKQFQGNAHSGGKFRKW